MREMSHVEVVHYTTTNTSIEDLRNIPAALNLESSDCDSDSIASFATENDNRSVKISGAERKTRASPVPLPRDLHATSDRDSVGSNESATVRAEKSSRLSAILDKAKSKGRKLVSSHKNKKAAEDTNSVEEACQVVSIGEDALYLDAESDVQSAVSELSSSPTNNVVSL
ncbi:unnamed protein product [Gongylonema pulchrum]|uniref:Uncharacterized protein n=1 Tax=Gongylonema pulchrum TaxID=637853 RepID=A0A183EIP2_9BILA|nr:unnamed protein product [Gongylonema pulchrum]